MYLIKRTSVEVIIFREEKMPTIFYDGHATCRVKDKEIFWIDPFYLGNPLFQGDYTKLEKPDVLLITHDHDDHIGQAVEIINRTHCKVACIFEIATHLRELGVSGDNILNFGMGFNIGGSVYYNDNKITMYQSQHTSKHGVPVGFVVETSSGFTFYHAGDTGLFSDMKMIGQLHSIDLAMLPIGDVFTMDGKQAAIAADYLNAKKVLPIHYKTFPVIEQNTDKFALSMKEYAKNSEHFVLEPNKSREY